jgi:uncharacterized protein YndB with AHSA1/START domain
MSDKSTNTADRELRISRVLNAPRELVWTVFTEPEHIKNWWGPDGFTNTIESMDVRPGGRWKFVMHGPDGTDYDNENIYLEVIKPERIVMEHVSPWHLYTITFTEEGDKTRIDWHMVFESKEMFEEVVKKYKADAGLRQNIEKLANYLYQL